MNGNNLDRQKQNAQTARTSASKYSPITLADVQGSAAEKTSILSSLMSQLDGSSRTVWLSAPLLVLLSALTQGTQILTPLVLIGLLGILLHRMDDTSRKLAAVPLCFGAFRLITNLALLLGSELSPAQRGWGGATADWETCLGVPWVPALFAAGLLYAPIKNAVTTKIIYWESVAMFIAGLIPGNGFVGILCVIHYTLFIAIIVGLVIDLQHLSLWGSSDEAPAVRISQA